MNVTVIMTIHQPGTEVVQLLDDLIILQKGGHLLAFGTREEVVARCESSTRSAESQTLSERILQWTEAKPKLAVFGRMKAMTALDEKPSDGASSDRKTGIRGNWLQVFWASLRR
jgi:ABC-type multidrug transport system ATPase subunit